MLHFISVINIHVFARTINPAFFKGYIFNLMVHRKLDLIAPCCQNFSNFFSFLSFIKMNDPPDMFSSNSLRERCAPEMSFYISTGSREVSSAVEDCQNPVSGLDSSANRKRSRRMEVLSDESKNKKGMSRPRIRVLNYNVLSQGLLESHSELYRTQNSTVLAWEYRSRNLFSEILELNPDILCFQEVEELELPIFYKNLEKIGYKGVTKMRTRNKGDGVAIYYRSPQIRILEWVSVEYRQPGVAGLGNRDNVGLVAKLEKEGKQFLVATTHLLYNPKRTDVRLAQLQMLLAEIHRIAKDCSAHLPVLLTGDFNSQPDSQIVTLLLEGSVSTTHRLLPSCLGVTDNCVHLDGNAKLHHSEKKQSAFCEEEIRDFPNDEPYILSQCFKFSSVYDISDKVPYRERGATTFQNQWVIVDYIFFTRGLELISRLSLPSVYDCERFLKHLPNEQNPSDHLPLVADFILS